MGGSFCFLTSTFCLVSIGSFTTTGSVTGAGGSGGAGAGSGSGGAGFDA
jgi:hypothetical protein